VIARFPQNTATLAVNFAEAKNAPQPTLTNLRAVSRKLSPANWQRKPTLPRRANMEKKDGGQATAHVSLRDYYANAALSGILAGCGSEDYKVNGGYLNASAIARDAFDIADAMIEERVK
jgi:hypothetical protein